LVIVGIIHSLSFRGTAFEAHILSISFVTWCFENGSFRISRPFSNNIHEQNGIKEQIDTSFAMESFLFHIAE